MDLQGRGRGERAVMWSMQRGLCLFVAMTWGISNRGGMRQRRHMILDCTIYSHLPMRIALSGVSGMGMYHPHRRQERLRAQ